MKRVIGLLTAVALLAAGVVPVAAQQLTGTLEKISQSGVLTIGTRTGSPPFAYVNAKNEWVGFSIDLVDELVKPAIERKEFAAASSSSVAISGIRLSCAGSKNCLMPALTSSST